MMRRNWEKLGEIRRSRLLRVASPETIPPARPVGLAKHFADLRVRPKLMVLHNLFFLVLAVSVYIAVIPMFEERVTRAKLIEVSLLTQMFADDRPGLKLPHMAGYDYREGTAEAVGIPPSLKQEIDARANEVVQDISNRDYLYRKDLKNGTYRRITLPNTVYDDVVHRAKVALFVVLGTIYGLAVIVLEIFIMPRYVYQPIGLMLSADRATQNRDHDHELIPEDLIPGDEIGQIMRSRNETVTELRRHEDELESALNQIEAQDRLASLGLLSASVAHEMNTPLAVLRGSIEKLIETVPERHAQERLGRMLRVTQRLQKISEGLVDFAKVRSREMKRVALRPLMDEAWSLVAIDEKASAIRFSNDVPEDESAIGNPDRLIQVFVNLLRNALDAVQESGNIRVATRQCMKEGKRWVAITVDDDGRGIPADVLPDIFDAFVTSRLDSRGTGLGLTVAEGIVQQHGGTITASNRPGGGARLEVTLRSAA